MAKSARKRRVREGAPGKMEHLRERFLNDLFYVAKFIHNLEWVTTITRTQNSSGKFKDLKKKKKKASNHLLSKTFKLNLSPANAICSLHPARIPDSET